jgi:hypothetical protein
MHMPKYHKSSEKILQPPEKKFPSKKKYLKTKERSKLKSEEKG